MSRRPQDDEYEEIPSIVPDRDDLVDHRPKKRGSSLDSAAYREPADDYPRRHRGRTSGGVQFMLTFLFLGLLATLGGGYWFYMQGEATKRELAQADSRIAELEGKLSAVGQDTEQTTLGLLQRIEENFTEIDKLWAARNALRTTSGEQQAVLDSHKALLAELDDMVTKIGSTMQENNAALGRVQASVQTITENVSGLESTSRQLAALTGEINTLKTSVGRLETTLNNRVGTVEQDIESINVYRLQLNQTITQLQTSLQQLQQRVGQ